jgi:hypothetical protein
LTKQGYKAITLPPFGIYALPACVDYDWLKRHEECHWDQYKRMGLVKYYVTYVFYHFKYGYKNNPMEIEARQREFM